MSDVLLSIKLKGQISGPVKHVDYQIVTLDLSKNGVPNIVQKQIKHNNRLETPCYRKLRFNEEIVNSLESSECPYWEKPVIWKKMSKKSKLYSHLSRYDEGLGINIDFIN